MIASCSPEIRPFCPGFCLKSVSFLTFSEKCKNQGSFCKFLIINKNVILHLAEHRGSYENGACFYQPPFLSGKIYPQNSYLANLPYGGGRSENADHFFNSRQKFYEVFFTKPLHKKKKHFFHLSHFIFRAAFTHWRINSPLASV